MLISYLKGSLLWKIIVSYGERMVGTVYLEDGTYGGS